MRAFLIGLQFLTRISLVTQTVWTEEDFGRSVRYFPAVGAVLGLAYVSLLSIVISLTDGSFPMLEAALAIVLSFALTGGIHCDGFMDSFDGLFCGRDRERMLEIMKDSRVGAFGAVSFVGLTLIGFATLSELARASTGFFLAALFSAPILGRLMMVMTIGLFRYARAEGMGKAFADRTTGSTLIFASVEAIVLLSPLIFFSIEMFLTALMSGLISLMIAFGFGRHATKKLGGVTGDIYGAVELLSEFSVPIVFLFLNGG